MAVGWDGGQAKTGQARDREERQQLAASKWSFLWGNGGKELS